MMTSSRCVLLKLNYILKLFPILSYLFYFFKSRISDSFKAVIKDEPVTMCELKKKTFYVKI